MKTHEKKGRVDFFAERQSPSKHIIDGFDTCDGMRVVMDTIHRERRSLSFTRWRTKSWRADLYLSVSRKYDQLIGPLVKGFYGREADLRGVDIASFSCYNM